MDRQLLQYPLKSTVVRWIVNC